jgi:hypothetical protein
LPNVNSLNPEWINKNLALKENPNFNGKDGEPKGIFDHVAEFSKSSNGTFRISQLLARVLKAASIIFESFKHPWSNSLAEVSKQFKIASDWLIFPRLPEVLYKAGQSIANWSKKPKRSISIVRDRLEKMGTLFEAAASSGFAAAAITSTPLIAQVAGVPDLARSFVDLSGAVEDFTAAKQVHDFADKNSSVKPEIVQNIKYTMRYKLIVMAKTVASVVTGTLGVLVLTLGGPILPAAVLLVIGIAGSIFAIWSHFYKETSKCKEIDFFPAHHVTVI